MRIRWFVLLAIAVPGVLALYVGGGWSAEARRDTLLGLVAVCSNGIVYGLSRITRSAAYSRRLAVALLAIDSLLVTALIFTNGGIESRSAILYTVPIMMSSAIFGRRAIYMTTLAVAGLYDGLIIGDYLNVIHSIGAIDPSLRSQLPYVISTVVFFSSTLLIIGTMANFIVSLLVEKELQASRSADGLKQAQAVAKVGSWEWDMKTDEVVWSDELCRIFGVVPTGEPVKYEEYIQRLHPDDRELTRRRVEAAMKDYKPFSFDHRVVWPDQTVVYVHGEGKVIVDKNGRPIKMLGTSQDMTAERILEKAKEEFVVLASHQLRTPATGVKMFLSLLAEGYAGTLTDEQQDFLGRAHQANERQLNIVNGMLSVATVESGKIQLKMVPTDLVSLVDNIVTEQSTAIQNLNQTVTLTKPSKPIMATLDPKYFPMVIDNLVSNASKYTDEGGRIDIKTFRQRGNAVIQIRDTGVGISKADMGQLFQKFSRVDNVKSTEVDGSGLGLYLVKRLVELHGGRITVQSRIGKGSTFMVQVPLVRSKSASSPVARHAEPPPV